MDPVKTEALTSWPMPKKLKELQSFLRFCNFYRWFIKDYSKIAKPLNQLTGKEEWKWSPEQDTTFNTLQRAIMEWPVLAIPVDNEPYRVEADSSNFALGAVLLQRQNDKWHPIAYRSQSLTSAEWNYKIYNKELLAIMTALDEWWHYLLTSKEFEIWMDHQNLCYFQKAQKLNWRQARWVMELGEYNFTMHHKPGKTNVKADILLRWVDHNRGEDNNKDITVLKDEWFRRIETVQRKEMEEGTKREVEQHLGRIVPELEGEKQQEAVEALAEMLREEWMRSMEVEMRTGEEAIIQQIKKLTKNERRIDQTVEKALRNKEKEWEREEGMITGFTCQKIEPYEETSFKPTMTKRPQDTLDDTKPRNWSPGTTGGHTFSPVSDDTWKGVNPVNKWKREKGKSTPLYNQMPSLNNLGEHITIDFITGLPILQGYNAIMVVVNRFTKYVIAIPTTREISSMGTTKLLHDHMWKQFGIPWKVISDWGPQFAAQIMKALHQLVGMKTNISTAYHPQMDGQTEWMNQEIKQYLWIFINKWQTNWVDWLSLATFSYNNKEQTSTGHSPFFLNHGRHPNKGLEPHHKVKSQAAQDFINELSKAQTEAKAALTKVERRWRHFTTGDKWTLGTTRKETEFGWKDPTSPQRDPARSWERNAMDPLKFSEKRDSWCTIFNSLQRERKSIQSSTKCSWPHTNHPPTPNNNYPDQHHP